VRVGSDFNQRPDARRSSSSTDAGTPLPSSLAGQFLVFKLQLDSTWRPDLRVIRCMGRRVREPYRISVKRAEGFGSRFFQTASTRGTRSGKCTEVASRWPRGGTVGSAIERRHRGPPVALMLYSLVSNASRGGMVVSGARNGTDHPFLRKLAKLLADLSHSTTSVLA